MGTIKKFGEFINEWVSSSTIDNYNDNDNGINNDGQREKNRERKTLIKNIWQEIKRNHLDKYLDFPEYDNLYEVEELDKYFDKFFDFKIYYPIMINLFLSMIPLHSDNMMRQKAMLANALKLCLTFKNRLKLENDKLS